MTVEKILALLSIIGIILGFLIWIGKVLISAGKLINDGKDVIKSYPGVRDDITEIKTRVGVLEKIYEYFSKGFLKQMALEYTESKSPMQLNKLGHKMLIDSGVDKIIDSQYDILFKRVSIEKPQNAYQVQEHTIEYVQALEKDTNLKDTLEKAAFNVGYDVSDILFVGAIYIRDRIIMELGFRVAEIDIHDPEKKEE